MLTLLLDEHISPEVGEGLHSRNKGIMVRWMAEWEGGQFLGQEDWLCLKEAAAQGFTLVTYDRRTIPALLKAWAEEDRSHGGVVFVDDKTISPAHLGGLIRALQELWRVSKDWDWTNRVYHLKRLV